jgi:polysaccharide biosynthesis protein PslG
MRAVRWAAVVTLALAAEAAAKDPSRAAAPEPDVGVAVEFAGHAHEQVDQMAAAGIGWIRTDLAWSHAELQPGVYDFSTWDRLVTAAQSRSIRVLLILDYGNALYDGMAPPCSDRARAAFAAFAGAAARHFRGRAAWEIWNEPNVPRFWMGAPDAACYVALARDAAEAIRREDPRAWILGPALGGDVFDHDYLDAAFRLGLLSVVDAVSLHPYFAASPEAAGPVYAEIRRMMRTSGASRTPIVVSEWGYQQRAAEPDEQADYLVRALTVNRSNGIALTVWYCWQEPILPWNSFGLIDVRGRAKAVYQALQALRAR